MSGLEAKRPSGTSVRPDKQKVWKKRRARGHGAKRSAGTVFRALQPWNMHEKSVAFPHPANSSADREESPLQPLNANSKVRMSAPLPKRLPGSSVRPTHPSKIPVQSVTNEKNPSVSAHTDRRLESWEKAWSTDRTLRLPQWSTETIPDFWGMPEAFIRSTVPEIETVKSVGSETE